MEILTEAERERFYADGYLKFRRVISDEQIAGLRGALARTIEEELTREEDADLPPEFRYGHDRKGQERASTGREARAIHQFVNIWKVCPEYAETIHNPSIPAVVRDLMQAERVRLWHDQVISKPPGDNKKFAFHHDFYFWPMDRPTMITCWLALDDATVENGCMHVIPGSHRDPRYQPIGCDLSEEIHLSPAPRGPPGRCQRCSVRSWPLRFRLSSRPGSARARRGRARRRGRGWSVRSGIPRSRSAVARA